MSAADQLSNYNETGGIFAGIVALLATFGGGVRWAVKWTDRRQETRAAKLLVWEAALDAREMRLDAERENEIRDIRLQQKALFQAYLLVVGALARLDPGAKELTLAAALLNEAYSFEDVPDDMILTALKAKRRGES